MPHFAKDVLESDLDDLARLHEILHGRRTIEPAPAGPAKALPTREERFGVPSSSSCRALAYDRERCPEGRIGVLGIRGVGKVG